MLSARGLRLPGVYFLPPQRADGLRLPRLDVAAFVGFAERGPLDTPVAIEDLRTYQAIFGGDLPLARDETGRMINAHLPMVVASFFANGGRRCYVVRVAGALARTTRFVVPGMLACDSAGNVRTAAIDAAWPGRWSANLRVGTRLQMTPLPASKFLVSNPRQLVWATDSAPQAIRPGDVLRLRFAADGPSWLFPVQGIRRPTGAQPLAILDAQRTWQVLRSIANPPQSVVSAARLSDTGLQSLPLSGDITMDQGRMLLTFTSATSLRRGDVLDLQLSDGTTILFTIADLQAPVAIRSPAMPGRAWADTVLRRDEQPMPQHSPPISPQQVERLRFDLLMQQGTQRLPVIDDLAFNAGHPRFWGSVALAESGAIQRQPTAQTDSKRAARPTRSQPRGGLFQEAQSDITSTPADLAVRIYREIQQPDRSRAYRDGAQDEIALAGLLAALDETAAAQTYLPLDMLALPSDADLVSATVIGDDDLGHFDARPFLDAYLVPFPNNQSTPADALMNEALDRYYIQEQRLRGLHSLLVVDEVALIAIPDALHRPWETAEAIAVLPPAAAPIVPPPDPCPPESPFVNCNRLPTITSISPTAGSLDGGTLVIISGSGFDLGNLPIVLFGRKAALEIKLIGDHAIQCVTPAGGMIGPVTLTVRTANGAALLTDAFTYQPRSSAPDLPMLIAAEAYDLDSSPLLAIQQALITICQARHDALALLSLPAHFEKRQCIEWQQRLRQKLGLPNRRVVYSDSIPSADLSHAAVYHPWLLLADSQAPDGLRAAPGDGAICGMIATHERRRQVWVAPANVPLTGVLGLTPEVSGDDWAELFDLQFNLVRPEPRDFRAMSAHTLGDMRALLQISVRRLMILLRKAALERGAEFVFENNHEQFRDGVWVMLNDMLRFLYERGAFAGETPQDSYRIFTGSSVNTPESIDQGRFIAEIQVRPSQPIEFLTVLLTRTDEGQVVVTER